MLRAVKVSRKPSQNPDPFLLCRPREGFVLDMFFMFSVTKTPKSTLAIIFTVGLLARVLYALVADPTLKNDESAYVEIAQNVLAGGTYDSQQDLAAYGMSQVRPPLLPWFIMAVFRIAGTNTLALRLSLAAFSSLVILASYGLARALRSTPGCALLTATLMALHPPLVVNASRVLTEAPFAVLITVISALFCTWRRYSSVLLPLLTGVTMGLAILCRATVLPFLLLLAPLWFFASRGWYRWWGLIAAASALLTILPWEIALFREHQRILPISTGGGFNLWCVNNPHMEDAPGVTHPTPEMRTELARLSEAKRDAYYQRLAIKWARANPRAFLHKRWRCFAEFWRLVPADLWNRKYPFRETYGVGVPAVMVAAAKIGWFSLLVILAISAIVQATRSVKEQRAEIWSLAGLVAMATAVHTVMISFPRYRIPFDPIWMTLGVLGLCTTWSGRARRSRPTQPAVRT
ncbi:MAG TPA: glycosyltransferase family 39 protein [Kiritimatiellia bacterium]|nr:glycosyltransferase family 39 protein [Kiritimatiellia bacterium]